ncbi:uncharacterized protein FMAN_12863 [Fusarium mangiferae]|uniref:Uncharacterized protein n=1 Tax=Fusarium mangiferae TaxID=192010 RepID=A0A1L7UA03_FUSMA|nr:uncharacterized protein FMAN_12863 [Fusarium mangiferae]CVL04785.1 uncharacterized protein FMAN_12863 [Fusarium mangiferae]
MSTGEQPIVPKASLLGLPLELRQQIYHEYFTVHGGYIHDGDSCKLVQANNQPIELSLRYACRAIAHETGQYPFTLNAITFSTVYRQNWRKQARWADYIMDHHSSFQDAMLLRLKRRITPEMYENPDLKYSQYIPIIRKGLKRSMASWDRFRDTVPEDSEETEDSRAFKPLRELRSHPATSGRCWGSTVISLSRVDKTIFFSRAVDFLLRQVAEKHPREFSQAIEEILPGWTDSHSVSEFFGLTFDAWAIPPVDEVKNKLEELQLSSLWQTPDGWRQLSDKLPGYTGPEYRYQYKMRLSAAAVAIKFLGQISRQQRLCISKLVLNDDRNAISSPESHVLGLIPFFQENTKLIVEHRLNLWRNILPTGANIAIAVEDQGLDLQGWDDVPKTHQARSVWFAKTVTNVIMNISKALTEGLPLRSYSLTIEGDPDLNHATEFFSTIMKPYIVWLTANTDCVAQGILLPPEHCNYPFDTRSSGKETTILRSNFTLDQPWNYKGIIEDSEDEIIGRSLESLLTGYGFEPEIVDVSTDILDWMEIKRENFLREDITKEADGETAA